jgi:hypothetical protein
MTIGGRIEGKGKELGQSRTLGRIGEVWLGVWNLDGVGGDRDEDKNAMKRPI